MIKKASLSISKTTLSAGDPPAPSLQPVTASQNPDQQAPKPLKVHLEVDPKTVHGYCQYLEKLLN
jgi:hypothetical protein